MKLKDVNNPLGIKGIDHLEFTTDSIKSKMLDLFFRLGFDLKESSKDNQKVLFQQGQVRFLVTAQDDSNCHSRKYFQNHGEGVSKIAFEVLNAEAALEEAQARGATVVSDLVVHETENGNFKSGTIQGFGDVLNEFVERPKESFRFDMWPASQDSRSNPLKRRVNRIDHLTNNVPCGEMEEWVDFYKKIYGFVETRFFDIKGQKTGLRSKVVQLKNNAVIIPINEPEGPDGQSQIQEFLDLHRGAGVQHIALLSPDIQTTVDELRNREVKFLEVPDTYYEAIPQRNFSIEESVEKLKELKILVDGDSDGYLLQIFSETCVGPLFFEYIQRKNHWGFGEGNFQALFDAIEQDQIRRGYLKGDARGPN